MVNLTAGRKALPNELVGLEEPTPYIHALFRYTAHMDKEKAANQKLHSHMSAAPAEPLARRIKAMSLNPSIYDKRR